MAASSRPLLKGLVWLHRWTGLVVCLFFALWFASGAVMLFVPFPSLPASERVEHAEVLDPALVMVPPAQALADYPAADSLTLRSRDSQPVYVIGSGAAAPVIVSAVTGKTLPPLDEAAGQRIAAGFSGATALVVETVTYDQWIVHDAFSGERPYWRVRLDDPAATTLYVSSVTGEVRQRTTRQQRMLNSLGAVPHWLYWTAIRQHWSFWDSLVWWLSLIALGSATLGMVLGVYRYIESRARGGSGWRVYVSWWRWHHVLGLTAGLFLLGWIASGWLSMDHGRLFSRGAVSETVAAQMRGQPLAAFAGNVSLTDLAELRPAASIQFHGVAGNGFLLVQRQQSAPELVMTDQPPPTSLPEEWLLAGLRAALPEATSITPAEPAADDLYARAEDMPASARLFLVQQPDLHRVYVDSLTGRILASQDASRRAYAWVYYALHTYKVSALAAHNTLRVTLMLLLLAGGFALSVTGSVIAWRRLRATVG